MTARRTATNSLFREALAAELRTAGYTARHAVKKPSRWAATFASAAAVGAIVASAGAAPWASAATGPAADSASRTELTSHELAAAPKHAAAAKPAASAKPSTIYDSVTPSAIPAGADAAVYSDGTYQASPAQVAGHKHVLWIDTNGSNTKASALDVEPGDATPAGAATWAHAKLAKDPGATAIIYTFKSAWPSVISNIHTLPASMQSHVKYWIADPTGTPHILPGAAATQWYWGANYDITAAQPGFTS